MLKLRSINRSVTPAVNTGNESSNKIAVKNTLHTNRGMSVIWIPILRMFSVVTMKLIAPNSDDIPDRCKLKIAKSTDAPECDWIPDKG